MLLKTTLLTLAILLPPNVPAQSVAPVRERQFPLGVVDATGKPMGPFLQADPVQAAAIVKVNGIAVPLTMGPLQVTDSSGTWYDSSRLVPAQASFPNPGILSVFYDAPSCQGNAYILADWTLVGFTPALTFGDNKGAGVLYVAQKVSPAPVLMHSSMATLSSCSNVTPATYPAFPTLPAIDLSTLFKAPYSVR